MNTASFLHCTDPRLGIRPATADTKNMTTRLAIRAILDALSGLGDRAVSAPALGFPVRVLGLRIGDNSTCLLNPKIISAGPISVTRGEVTPHSDPFWRNAFRAKSLIIEGTSLVGGREQQLAVPDGAVLSVQQAFDLINHPDPFGWLTPFHRLWIQLGKSDQAARYAGVNAGLRAASMGQANAVGLRAGKGDLIEVLLENDQPADIINGMNPLVPPTLLNQFLLALLLEFSSMRNMLLTDTSKISLAVAAMLISPGMKVSFGGCRVPQQAIATLGLTQCFSNVSWDLTNFPDNKDAIPEFSSVVLDCTRTENSGTVAQIKTAAIARALSGKNSGLFIVCPAEDSATEQILQRHFSTVLLFQTGPDGPIVYIARKSDADGGVVRARLFGTATQIGATVPLLAFQSDSWRLRKDGKRESL